MLFRSPVETLFRLPVETLFRLPVETLFRSLVETLFRLPVEACGRSLADTLLLSDVETLPDRSLPAGVCVGVEGLVEALSRDMDDWLPPLTDRLEGWVDAEGRLWVVVGRL
jgi:hypothetical protein